MRTAAAAAWGVKNLKAKNRLKKRTLPLFKIQTSRHSPPLETLSFHLHDGLIKRPILRLPNELATLNMLITPSTICFPTMFSFLWLLSALVTFIRLLLTLSMFSLFVLLLIARHPALASM
jgi:hypothetical protein